MSFSEFIKRYAESGALRLHTPGHKGKIDPLDLSELVDGSFPAPQMLEAKKKVAAHFKAKHAYLLAGGSSQGVKASIFFAGCDGIVDTNSHRSVFDGFTLSGKRCVQTGSRGVRPITVKDIAAKLDKSIGAVVVTSPTYFGYCADIDGIADFCRARGLLFVVDGAHGAHFGASELLPPMFSDKCDVCNLSTHKTMFSLTQSAVLVDNLDERDAARLDAAVDVMGTTSPSYALYASIENAVELSETDEYKNAYRALFDPIEALGKKLPFLKNDDFTRLVLDCSALGVDPKRLCGALCSRGVYGELVTYKYIVFLFTAADTPENVERLKVALDESLTEI